ncbi:DNA replication licensing factor mcm8 [Binucleata daphniae]
MLNRFDLVFTMLEEFDENKMRKIIGLPDISDENKVVQVSKNQITSYIQNKAKQDDIIINDNIIVDNIIDDNVIDDNVIDDNHLDMDVIKQYILHCRETISPVLSSKAKQRIKSYWLEQRKNNCTIQVLLTLKRLTEARAKINCREVASTKDADFAINLYKETKIITKKKGKFLDDLRERKGKMISKQQIEKMMNEYKVKQNIDCYIEKLNYQGIIIKKGKDQYKIT